ncbi:hypothetical protein C8Q79DRAFT_923109 [Trametes meyenii]|nr:hypothetical protein C8Q79DRAFT_923109 [Trametes meyenii]
MPLPVEILEEIVAESWKTSASFDGLRQLYENLTKTNSVFKDIIARVALRFVVIPGLDILDYPKHGQRPGTGHLTFYRRLASLAEEKLVLSGDSTAHLVDPYYAMVLPFWDSHLHFQGEHHWVFTHEVLFGTEFFDLWRLVLGRIRSFTFSPLSGEKPASPWEDNFASTHDLLSTLQIATRLTHLHLDYDRCDMFRGRDGSARQHVVLPSVTFVRTRSYLCCGAASPSAHAPDCKRAGARVAETFPGLRELQLDAPLFLKYFAPTPRGLEVVRLDAGPPGDPLRYSVQGYNLGAGLKNGFLGAPQAGRAARRARGSQDAWARRTVIVRIGAEVEPLGWQQAESACVEFGVRLVKEVVFDGAHGGESKFKFKRPPWW